jgi:hypothetical protein
VVKKRWRGEVVEDARVAEQWAYAGGTIIEATDVDGFRLGELTPFDNTEGDAFVVAPDGSTAGFIWFANATEEFSVVHPAEPNRWGVYAISRPLPMRDADDAREFLRAALIDLRPRWLEWRDRTTEHQ